MAGPFYYINTTGSKVATTGAINLCRSTGPMSICSACTVADQPGCSYREDATNAVHCLYYRENMDGACDSVWAQTSKPNPNKAKE